MESIERQYAPLRKILGHFSDAIALYQQSSSIQELESLIKRCELSYELFWKYLKTVVVDVHRVTESSQGGPRRIFRDMLRLGLCSEEEIRVCLVLVEARNRTVHSYGRETAVRIAEKAPQFSYLLNQMVGRLAPDHFLIA